VVRVTFQKTQEESPRKFRARRDPPWPPQKGEHNHATGTADVNAL
jgi:hypothetical protein